jgi:LDH2 family malate/lactate/ureidoglycolate dehydrogenase
MALEVLSGILTGSGIADAIGDLYDNPDRPQNLGHFAAAIDVSVFLPVNDFRRAVDHLIDLVKHSPLAPGHAEILIPGEREHLQETEARANGLQLEPEARQQLHDLARSVGAARALEILNRANA